MSAKTTIAHAWRGDRHGVAAELRVLVSPSEHGDYFVAQGIDIDYIATAKTEAEVRNDFAEGFVRTVFSMLARGRDLAALWSKSRVPSEAVAAYEAAGSKELLHCVQAIDLTKRLPADAQVPRKVIFHSTDTFAVA